MKSPDGTTTPIWKRTNETPAYPKPPFDLGTQVCVVGAGISGLTSAYLLAKEGKKVVVVDDGPVGGGQTERTSAHLASAIDDRFYEIERLLGRDASKAAHASHAAAIDTIERIARAESIDCQFARVDAYLFLADGDERTTLEDENAAAKRADFAGVEIVELAPVPALGAAINFPNQGVFDPLAYLYGLAKACERLGVRIFTGKRVIDVQGADPKKNEPCTVTFEDEGKLRAEYVVVATNTPSPINDWAGIYTKQSSYRTYMVGLRVAPGSVPDALYWDTGDPYHYVRLLRKPAADGTDVLLVGGEDHKVGQAGASDERFAALEAWTRSRFPGVGEVVTRWSGQVQEPDDGLGFIGKAPTKGENVYCITGDSGMGLTHGTLGGMICTDLIAGRTNPWASLYDPSRKESNREFVKENLNVTAQYADYITPGDVSNESQIAPHTGAVLREGLKKLAVYRDPSGTVHKCSAVCTHLYCVVHWNDVEKSWDCPCHGSRFDPHGRVVMGPAVDDLKPVE